MDEKARRRKKKELERKCLAQREMEAFWEEGNALPSPTRPLGKKGGERKSSYLYLPCLLQDRKGTKKKRPVLSPPYSYYVDRDERGGTR